MPCCRPAAARIILSTDDRISAREALAIDHTIEGHGSPDQRACMDIARERGMREAITWRDARFRKAQDGG